MIVRAPVSFRSQLKELIVVKHLRKKYKSLVFTNPSVKPCGMNAGTVKFSIYNTGDRKSKVKRQLKAFLNKKVLLPEGVQLEID